MSTPPHIVVVGAGAFGGWTALELVRRGAEVTLLDAWAPGHVRASSGGETRVIRATYGSHGVFTAMARRALDLWRAHEQRQAVRFYHRTGALWMFGDDDSFGQTSSRTLRDHGIPIEQWTLEDAARRYPQVDFVGVRSVLFEPDAGYLMARRACEHVAGCVVAEGGHYRVGAALSPADLGDGPLRRLTLLGGETIDAEAFVFACGPWLGELFPDVVGPHLSVTKQEVYYFATPPGDSRFDDPSLPVWLDFGAREIYGIPGNAGRGFKLADDAAGPPFDPTSGEREVSAAGTAGARRFIARRFPVLRDAPLLGFEVCQYETTPDAFFILDRHPRCTNVWIAGGGSGHGFKMGPAIGEMLAALVLEERAPEPAFSLLRFSAPPSGGWRAKWS